MTGPFTGCLLFYSVFSFLVFPFTVFFFYSFPLNMFTSLLVSPCIGFLPFFFFFTGLVYLPAFQFWFSHLLGVLSNGYWFSSYLFFFLLLVSSLLAFPLTGFLLYWISSLMDCKAELKTIKLKKSFRLVQLQCRCNKVLTRIGSMSVP